MFPDGDSPEDADRRIVLRFLHHDFGVDVGEAALRGVKKENWMLLEIQDDIFPFSMDAV